MTKPVHPASESDKPKTDTTDIAQVSSLTGMITTAAAALARASTSAEVLDVIQRTNVAYDAAKITARLAKARDAHAEIIAACNKAQADALEIKSEAQCRLADEYDAAQERGEVQKAGGDRTSNVLNENNAPTVTDIGLTRKQVHEARAIRDAEKAEPGIIRKTLDEQLSKGGAPTRADIKRAIEPKPTVAAAPLNTFAPDVVSPETVADDDTELVDDTHLGLHVYAGRYSDGDVRISSGRDAVFLESDQVLELLHWIEHDYLPHTKRERFAVASLCSFCGTRPSNIETMIRADEEGAAHICEDCAHRCIQIIEQRRKAGEKEDET